MIEILEVETTKRDQIVDITEKIRPLISCKNGIVVISALHTTCAITTADQDPGTDLDILEAFRRFLPKDIQYRHPHDASHAEDHILASLIGPSITLHIERGELLLGTWQRVVLVEFYGPRTRQIAVNCMGA